MRENPWFTATPSQRFPKISTNTPRQFHLSATNKVLRCKYCYRSGHIDANCRQKAMNRSTSIPEWVSKAKCKKCKKKGHLSFNCPPKYDNKPIKHKNEQKYNKYNNKETANVYQFAGMTSHHLPYCWTRTDQQNKGPHPKHQKNLQNHNINLNHIEALYHSILNRKKFRNHIRDLWENKTKYKVHSTKKDFKTYIYIYQVLFIQIS